MPSYSNVINPTDPPLILLLTSSLKPPNGNSQSPAGRSDSKIQQSLLAVLRWMVRILRCNYDNIVRECGTSHLVD
jgi:hypothetical protein